MMVVKLSVLTLGVSVLPIAQCESTWRPDDPKQPTIDAKDCMHRFGCGSAPTVGGVAATWVPEIDSDDDRLFTHFLAQDVPVIVRDASFARASIGSWTPERFDAHLPKDLRLHAFLSRNRYVSYHVPGTGGELYDFTPPVLYRDLPWADARGLADSFDSGRCEAIARSNATACNWDYCHIDRLCSAYFFLDGERFRSLVESSQELGRSYDSWDWPWLERVRTAADWSGPAYGTGTAMVVGQVGATMTPHFDSHGNVVLQIFGRKSFVLWPPEDTAGLYPFPSNHAATRQAMLNPDTHPRFGQGAAFPRYAATRPQRGELKPGDVLHLPLAWWHMIRTETHLATSVSFWHDSRRPGPFSPPPPSLRGATEEHLAMHTALLWTRLEALVKENVGDAGLDKAMVAMQRMNVPDGVPGFDRALQHVRSFLMWLFEGDPVRAGKYVEKLVAGRFGVNHDRCVHIWYLSDSLGRDVSSRFDQEEPFCLSGSCPASAP